MKPDAITRQIDATGADNDLLEVLLGYQQVLTRVARAAKARTQSSAVPDERAVMLVLGVLALEANLARWLRASAAGAIPDNTPAASDAPRGLLR